ncbi:MAG: hypothetical protein ACI8RZ_007340 [Myxococcota bacterium]|jgi:hypothetical protein
MTSPRVLLVGAGAVGLVYGRHLQRGGADVNFYVRPKYAEEVSAGFSMYNLNHSHKPTRFEGFGVLTELEAVEKQEWDQVWLCISSTALQGDWLAPFLAATGAATIISLQPGLFDQDNLSDLIGAERLVTGLISFSSWHAPLPETTRPEPGFAYWHPPLAQSRFDGPRAAAIVACLKAGDCPAGEGGAVTNGARGTAMLLPIIAAMEIGGWTFAGLRAPEQINLAAQAIRQASAITCQKIGISAGPVKIVARPLVIAGLYRLAPRIAPFDIERFFQSHFTKVGDQTLQALTDWIDEGERGGMPTDALASLKTGLIRARGQTTGSGSPG